ncbi:MAG: hypothetical protein IKP86_08045, partial [Anaerolineaceae bacterium]|nr:hypothetical protein [Anaerolineaceae bacterium]
MEQNQYQNPNGMPQANGPYPQNGQMPYGGMPYPQQSMPQGMPNYGQENMYPANNMVPPQYQNVQQNTPAPTDPKGKKKASKKSGSKKHWIALGIFAVIGVVLGGLTYSLVNRYAKQMTIIELPGAPIIVSAPDTSTVSADID